MLKLDLVSGKVIGKNISMLRMNIKKPVENQKDYLLLFIDISGSMDSSCDSNDSEQQFGFSRLDLAKHAAKALVDVYRGYLTLIFFHSDIIVKHTNLNMSHACNRDSVIDDIENIEAQNYTNFYGALRKVEDILSNKTNGVNYKTIILTDGAPYTYGMGSLDKKNNVKNNELVGYKNKKIENPIWSIAFGNDANIDFLENLSKFTNGKTFYISDISMIAQKLIYAFALFTTTILDDVKIRITPTNNTKIDTTSDIYKAYEWKHNNNYIERKIGSMFEGQNLNILVPTENDNTSSNPSFNVKFLTKTMKGFTEYDNDYTSTGLNDDDKDLSNNYYRVLLTNVIKDCRELMKYRQLKQKEDKLIDFTENVWKCEDTELSSDLYGQIYKAFNMTTGGKRDDWYDDWGKNFTLTLKNQHLLMYPDNNKDWSNKYESEALKKQVKLAINSFDNLPPPKKVTYQNENTRQITSMSNVNSYSSSSISCYHNDCFVTLPDNGYKFVKNIKKGDKVLTKNNETATVLYILKTEVGKKIRLIRLKNGCIITPYHPVYRNDECKFPIDCEDKEYITIETDAVYSFVLDKGHIMFVNGEQTVTLGHDLPGLAKHDYYGTHKVIDDIREKCDENGVAITTGVIRDGGNVLGLLF